MPVLCSMRHQTKFGRRMRDRHLSLGKLRERLCRSGQMMVAVATILVDLNLAQAEAAIRWIVPVAEMRGVGVAKSEIGDHAVNADSIPAVLADRNRHRVIVAPREGASMVKECLPA